MRELGPKITTVIATAKSHSDWLSFIANGNLDANDKELLATKPR